MGGELRVVVLRLGLPARRRSHPGRAVHPPSPRLRLPAQRPARRRRRRTAGVRPVAPRPAAPLRPRLRRHRRRQRARGRRTAGRHRQRDRCDAELPRRLSGGRLGGGMASAPVPGCPGLVRAAPARHVLGGSGHGKPLGARPSGRRAARHRRTGGGEMGGVACRGRGDRTVPSARPSPSTTGSASGAPERVRALADGRTLESEPCSPTFINCSRWCSHSPRTRSTSRRDASSCRRSCRAASRRRCR